MWTRPLRWLKRLRGFSAFSFGLSWDKATPEPYTQEECRGVEVAGRYFDWYGPTLHTFEERKDVPALREILAAIEAEGFSLTYIPPYQIAEYSDQRKYQIFETDRASWRRAVSHDGALLVVHDPTFNGLTVENPS